MAYEKAYELIGFVNGAPPSLGATNLNKIDSAINELDDRVVELSAFNELLPETYATKSELAEISETVTEIATEVSKGKADVILANASGESIHLADSTDNKVTAFAILGNASQKQYTGKSKLPVTLVSGTTYNSITATVTDKGVVSLNGKNDSDTYATWFPIFGTSDTVDAGLPNGKYIVSFENPVLYGTNMRLNFTDGTYSITALTTSDLEVEFEVTDEKKLGVVWLTITKSLDVSGMVYHPMIRLASVTDNTWEPYVGGTPSPNPEYPQNIEVLGADGSVEVKSIGKNFIPYPYYEQNHTDNGIEWTDLGDGRLKANGTASANSDYFMVSYNDMRTFKAGTYIVNGCPGGGGESTHSIIVGKKVDGTLTRITLANESGATFTLTEDTDIYVACRVSTGQTVSNLIFEPMISLEGGKFEPYKESTTNITTKSGLAGIKVSSGGNYTDASGQQWITDEIFKYADGSGKHIQRIGHKTYNGSESIWRRVANEAYSTVFYADNSLIGTVADRWFLSNMLLSTTVGVNQVVNGYGYFNTNSKMIYFAYGENSEENTLEGWKEFLASNNLSFYYVLVNPIITDLTAEEVAELEVQTFYPTTNILNDANCGMEVTYKADTKNYIDKIIGERITALETALINNI